MSASASVNIRDIGPTLEAAIAQGLARYDSGPSQVAGLCATNNCTFDEYGSLAICYTIEDITQSIIKDCRSSVESQGPDANDGCTYSVPALNNPNITGPIPKNFTCSSGGGDTIVFAPLSVSQGVLTGNTLTELYVFVETNETSKDGPTSCQQKSMLALKATLDLCVQSFQTQIVNKTTQTQIIRSSNNTKGNSNDGYEWAGIDGSGVKFNVTPDTASAFGDYLTFSVFLGSAYLDYQDGGDNYIYWDEGQYFVADFFTPEFHTQDRSTSVNNFAKRIDNIAISMTNGYDTLTAHFLRANWNPVSVRRQEWEVPTL